MKIFKVVCLEAGGLKVVNAEEIESTITYMTAKGWNFSKISTGGAGGGDYTFSWVYLVFER